MRSRPKYSDELRQRALKLAEEVGAAEAAKRLNVNPNTLRWWRMQAGSSGPPKGTDPIAWAERKERGAANAYEAAVAALTEIRKKLEAGDHRGAKDLAITFGVLTDKHGVLREAAAREHGRHAELVEQQAQQLAAVVKGLLAAFNIDLNAEPVRELVRHLMTEVGRGRRDSPDPNIADAARAAVRKQWGIPDLGGGAPQLEAGDDSPRGLPEQARDPERGENVMGVMVAYADERK